MPVREHPKDYFYTVTLANCNAMIWKFLGSPNWVNMNTIGHAAISVKIAETAAVPRYKQTLL